MTTGKPTGVMRTDRMYENYVIELDWMHLKKGGNAGLFVHSGAVPVQGDALHEGPRDPGPGRRQSRRHVDRPRRRLLDPRRHVRARPPHPKGWMRCLPSEKRSNPSGQWNHYRVSATTARVKLAVNGKEVSGGTKCNPRKGYICLESEGSECHFKNIRIKELPSTNPPESEIAEADQGFHTLYTGLDFRGWTPEGEWKAADWVFEGAGSGTVLWSESKSYRNFELLFDWRSKTTGSPAILFNQQGQHPTPEGREAGTVAPGSRHGPGRRLGCRTGRKGASPGPPDDHLGPGSHRPAGDRRAGPVRQRLHQGIALGFRVVV